MKKLVLICLFCITCFLGRVYKGKVLAWELSTWRASEFLVTNSVFERGQSAHLVRGLVEELDTRLNLRGEVSQFLLRMLAQQTAVHVGLSELPVNGLIRRAALGLAGFALYNPMRRAGRE